MILEDDGYKRITRNDVSYGDVVIYVLNGRRSHVGLIVDPGLDIRTATKNPTVLSQWGADGEYFHNIDDINPYLGKPAEYWTDRPL